MQDPAQVARALEEIATLLRLAGSAKFRSRAHEHAARVVAMLGSELGPLVEQGRLREVHGIGAALSQLIEELWNRGTSSYLERLRADLPPGAAELARVPGMTLKRMRALHHALGVTSVSELRAACASGRVRTVAGFGSTTEQRLLDACDRCAPEPSPSVSRPHVLTTAFALASEIQQELARVAEQVELAGDLRRGHELVRDLAFVVRPAVGPALQQLARSRRIIRVDLAGGLAQASDGTRIRLHAAGRNWGNVMLTSGDARPRSRQRAGRRRWLLEGRALFLQTVTHGLRSRERGATVLARGGAAAGWLRQLHANFCLEFGGSARLDHAQAS